MTALTRKPLSFADDAPWRFDFEGQINATPADVWAAFVDNESWTTWFKRCRECRATSTPFGGVGSTRHISVNGLTVDEEFIGWEPERLWAFTAVQMRMSFAKAMVERAQFEPLPDDRTKVSYRMAIEPHGWAKPIRRIVQSQAARTFEASFAGLDTYLATQRSR
jgi:uncharacterized protein YndB with AHSA1/START domain